MNKLIEVLPELEEIPNPNYQKLIAGEVFTIGNRCRSKGINLYYYDCNDCLPGGLGRIVLMPTIPNQDKIFCRIAHAELMEIAGGRLFLAVPCLDKLLETSYNLSDLKFLGRHNSFYKS